MMTALAKLSMTVGVLIATGGLALAQPAPPPPPPSSGGGGNMMAGDSAVRMKSVGADASVLVPIGDYGDVGVGVGADVRVEVPVAPQISVTGRLGYLMFTGTPSGSSFAFIPVLGGIRYDLTPSGQGLFVLGEVGFTNIRVSVDGFGSADETKFSFGAGAGFQTGKISLRGTLFIPDTGHAGDSLAALVSAGYDFANF